MVRCAILLVFAASSTCTASEKPALIMYDLATLQKTRLRVAAGDTRLAHAVTLLRADAEVSMGANSWTEGAGPWSVMNKSVVGPSGDPHDYFSTAKYCWPCNTICNATIEKVTGNDCSSWKSGHDYHPQKCNNNTGLPWLCHDGFANPINDHTDRGLWDSLYYTVPTLALNAFLTDNATQAKRAAMLVRTWFLDESTRMNPNLNYAQAIPGLNNGTNGGIIDFSDHHKMLDIIDGMTLLVASPNPAVSGTWTAGDAANLMSWVTQFKHWVVSSKLSHAEAKAHNNHGTWHDLLQIGLSLYTMDTANASQVCSKYLEGRIAVQVQPSGATAEHGGPGAGALPMEDGRTNSQNYHSMDADGLLLLAKLCSPLPDIPDLIHASVPCRSKFDGHAKWESPCKDDPTKEVSLANVPSWAAPYALGKEKWPFQQISSGEEPYYWPQVFRRAANLYGNPDYEAIVQSLPEGGVSPKYVLDLTEPYLGPQVSRLRFV